MSAVKLLRVFWFGVIAAGCSSQPREPMPEALVPGVDICINCRMTADDPLRAAQWVGADNEHRKFDEVGCLVEWLSENAVAGTGFVADAVTGEWVRADRATYVRVPATNGMGFGITAYASAASARAAASARSGTTMSWAQVLEEGVPHAH